MGTPNDEYGLQRFVDAQEPVYDEAVGLLRRGLMCTPYMDFIFPRIVGSHGPPDNRFAIASLDEARALLAFPILGNRYRESVEALSWLADISPVVVFAEPDVVKLHASLTLFAEATGEPVVRTMLTIWFYDRADEATMDALERQL